MDIQQTQMEPQTNNKKFWIIGAATIILILSFFAMRGDNTNQQQGVTTSDQNSIVMADQDPDAVAIFISQVSFITPGFIVIQEENSGIAGKIVAISELYKPGFYQNKTIITTLRPGGSYFATLYGDDGNGIFDQKADPTLKDPAGALVQTPFKVKLSSRPGDIKG